MLDYLTNDCGCISCGSKKNDVFMCFRNNGKIGIFWCSKKCFQQFPAKRTDPSIYGTFNCLLKPIG